METKKEKKAPLLLTLIFLTILAIAQQAVRMWKLFGAILGQDTRTTSTFIKHLFTAHQISIAPIVWIIFAQLLLYTAFTTIIYAVTKLISQLFKFNDTKQYLLGILLWFMAIMFVMVTNSYMFPHSCFAIPANMIILGIAALLGSIIVGTTLLLAIIELFRRHAIFMSVAFVAIAIIWYLYSHPTINRYVTPTNKPNIVIIGLDSIRPDHIKFYGNKTIETPHINSFLKKSTAFTQAYSPLARTYVAWNTILQGQYPKHDEVRDNLVDPGTLNLQNTLATILRRHGYQTIFATDSRQFSLITKRFGFDKIVSPDMGVYDFIFSLLNDFPLSNLIMNSILGKWLFPYNYANRMSYVTYQPETFVKFLQRGLVHRKSKPLFLGMHLILTHWPFMWAKDQEKKHLPMPIAFNYTIKRIDRQFANVMKMLKKDNILKHAIVILISDHGLGLGLPGDRVIAVQNYIGDINATKLLTKYAYSPVAKTKDMPYLGLDTTSGEGTDVLGFNVENRIIFGIRAYGLKLKQTPRKISYPIALIDIAPTILDLLNLPPKITVDGLSLKPFITNNIKHKFPKRALFFETGVWMPLFNMQDLKNGTAGKYLMEKLRTLFTFKPKGNLVVTKQSVINRLLKSKQRGILYGNWFLARYPDGLDIRASIIPDSVDSKKKCAFSDTYSDEKDNKTLCYNFIHIPKPFYVLANTKTGKWTMNLDSTFAKKSPLKALMQKLKAFYGKEI